MYSYEVVCVPYLVPRLHMVSMHPPARSLKVVAKMTGRVRDLPIHVGPDGDRVGCYFSASRCRTAPVTYNTAGARKRLPTR
jgi:hypothetical protein